MVLQSLFPQKIIDKINRGQGNGRGRMKALGRGWVFKFDSENFIDPGAKRNYGNELAALKRSSAVVIVSPSNPSYLRIKLTYIYTNTHI